ncbi:MAG: cupredoxin family protein [Ferrovibrio sp.]|uniref:cupredoxin domain-containing protein n=1 Tax=Ferrovibrio sp. TaxID=1917215 RepID=UPI002615C505|nr:cupredoxin family protein [Ferrovibrio sp.]MCW0234627.1 cupredoxin family protein [Ferrovibrio sp.]
MASVFLNTALAVAAIAGLPLAALAHGPEQHSPIGEPGTATAVSRTVAITMNDQMRFVPSNIAVKRGETVRFVVKNAGGVPHEFMLGEIKALKEHAEVMRQHPTMEHDEPNAITVQPAGTGELIWRFTTAGRVDFACLVPGHFEQGMKGGIQVGR